MKKQFEKSTDPHIKDILFRTALQLNIFYEQNRKNSNNSKCQIIFEKAWIFILAFSQQDFLKGIKGNI